MSFRWGGGTPDRQHRCVVTAESFNMASDTIFTGNMVAGSGGTGVSDGSVVNVNVGYFEPMRTSRSCRRHRRRAADRPMFLPTSVVLQIAGVGGFGGMPPSEAVRLVCWWTIFSD